MAAALSDKKSRKTNIAAAVGCSDLFGTHNICDTASRGP
jgi:hypothetical protein